MQPLVARLSLLGCGILKVSHICAIVLMLSEIAMMQAGTVHFTAFVSSVKKKNHDLENILINVVNFLHQVAASCSSVLIITM